MTNLYCVYCIGQVDLTIFQVIMHHHLIVLNSCVFYIQISMLVKTDGSSPFSFLYLVWMPMISVLIFSHSSMLILHLYCTRLLSSSSYNRKFTASGSRCQIGSITLWRYVNCAAESVQHSQNLPLLWFWRWHIAFIMDLSFFCCWSPSCCVQQWYFIGIFLLNSG